uniref:Glucose-1-phosphate adenylyltransferase n=1 Tax=Chloropicon laureae TaxID=464258 RepID=A0A7S2Z633_9CHLO
MTLGSVSVAVPSTSGNARRCVARHHRPHPHHAANTRLSSSGRSGLACRAAAPPSGSPGPSGSRRQQQQEKKSVVGKAVQLQDEAYTSAELSDELVMNKLDMQKTVLGVILGGGAGTRLYPLTKKRAKPAVPLGANYRLIDIPVSNCINSGINKMYCLTQFNSASLNRHMSQAYNAIVGGGPAGRGGFVEVLAAQQSPTNPEWFQGTADAVRQYLWLFQAAERDGIENYLILSGDHLYRMDYSEFVERHVASGADITVSALPCDEKRASAFGLMKIDDTGRIFEFAEKPQGEALKNMQVDTTVLGLDEARAQEMPYIASMGIYVFKTSAMIDLLTKHFPNANDFGSEVIPGANAMGMNIQAFLFDGYWEDIGTIEAFYKSNLALCESGDKLNFSFYDHEFPIYTMSRFLPPSKMIDCEINDSVIGDGCVIRHGSRVSNSVVGLRSLIGSNCVIEDALIMGSDYYETMDECELLPGCMPIGLGNGTTVRKCIIDKNARIGHNCQIINKDNVQEAMKEEEGYIIKDGIVVIIKDSIIPDGTII